MSQIQSESEDTLSEEEISELASELADSSDFFDDVINVGLYEAIVEGGHGFAVDQESAELLIEELVFNMEEALEEF